MFFEQVKRCLAVPMRTKLFPDRADNSSVIKLLDPHSNRCVKEGQDCFKNTYCALTQPIDHTTFTVRSSALQCEAATPHSTSVPPLELCDRKIESVCVRG